MAQPADQVRRALRGVIAAKGLADQLGDRIFSERNWHQSLSDRVPFSTLNRDRMLRAGARINVAAFTLELNRLASRGDLGDPKIHWESHPTRRLAAFNVLLAAARRAMKEEGMEDIDNMPGNTPHITITYRAPAPIPIIEIRSIPWRIDELLLVEARMEPHYHYHVLARWPLRAAPGGLESQRALW